MTNQLIGANLYIFLQSVLRNSTLLTILKTYFFYRFVSDITVILRNDLKKSSAKNSKLCQLNEKQVPKSLINDTFE